jgi:hypothetical protein
MPIQKCDRTKLARRIREAKRMPVASKMKPLRDHMLRLAINSAKHGHCQAAGREVSQAMKIAERDPDDLTYQRAVRAAASGRRR